MPTPERCKKRMNTGRNTVVVRERRIPCPAEKRTGLLHIKKSPAEAGRSGSVTGDQKAMVMSG